MLSPLDLLVCGAVAVAVVWLELPKLLLPALALTISVLFVYRWRREDREPRAAERYRMRLMASAVVIAAISVPLILQVVPPNGLYGFRTAVTRSRADIWYSANAFMGWALLLGAALATAGQVYLPATAKRGVLLAAFLLPLLGAVVASFTYLDWLA